MKLSLRAGIAAAATLAFAVQWYRSGSVPIAGRQVAACKRMLVVFALLVVATSVAHAQQAAVAVNPFVGVWYGLIDNYTYSDPRRVLKVTARDQKFVCTWDEVGKTIDYPAACEINGTTVNLTTGFGSKISLTLMQQGLSLKGTFTLKSGEVFPVAMGRTEEAMLQPNYDKKLEPALDGLLSNAAPTKGFASWRVCKAQFSGRVDGGLWVEPHGPKVSLWADFSPEGMKHYADSQRGSGFKNIGSNSDWVEKGSRVETWSWGGIHFFLDFTTPSTFNLSFRTEAGWPYKGDGICSR